MNNSNFTSLALKLTGTIFVLSSLLDFITLAIPLNWQNAQWQIGLVTNIVDRGIVPLVGISFILVGYWIDSRTSEGTGVKPSGFDLRLPTFILASVLGLLFLLVIPLHVNNINQAKTTALEQIEKGAGQGEEQIKAFLAQVNTLGKNPQLLSQQIAERNQVIETGQFRGQQLNAQQLATLQQQRDQLQQLRDLAQKPQEFKKRIEEIKSQLETRLLDQRKNAESQANIEAYKQSLRIGLSSLMLAIGYSAIGWLGLTGFGGSKTTRSKR